MNKKISRAIEFYCRNEEETLKESKYFQEISSLVDTLGFSVNVSVEGIFSYKKASQVVYLGISVFDGRGKTLIVDTLDYEHLSYATKIVNIDSKGRVNYYVWEEDMDFVETLGWIIEQLKKLILP